MTSLVLLVLMQSPSAPPLPPVAPVQVINPIGRPGAPLREEPKVIHSVLHFAPGSLFALYGAIELERALAPGFTAFAGVGIGLTAMYGFDLGVRHYLLQQSFDGLFVGARVSGFGVIGTGHFNFGPGVEVGYSTRVSRDLVLNVGGGITTWWNMAPNGTGRFGIFGNTGTVSSTRVMWLPGVVQPVRGDFAPQPTVRLTVGPGF